MKRRARQHGGYWQSYADLAMGLMAVLCFILILLLAEQGETNAKLVEVNKELGTVNEELKRTKATKQAELDLATKEREALRAEREKFAVELMKLIEESWQMVERQDQAEQWLQQIFETTRGCMMRLTETGSLVKVTANGTIAEGTNLYASGDTTLSPDDRSALTSCRASFVRLASCLTPDSDRARKRCLRNEGDAIAAKADQLRRGVDSLVLSGSTDRRPYQAQYAFASAGAMEEDVEDLLYNYATNAALGGERSRLAVTFLASLVGADSGVGDDDPLPVLLSKIRIESASFGRYMVGPSTFREGHCSTTGVDCDEARNLSLRMQWKKEELRRPYEEVRRAVCERLRDPSGAFAQGLRDAGKDVVEIATRFHCEPATP